jgi:hypothetical protein
VAAGQRPGVLAKLAEQLDGIGDRFGTMVLKGAWDHGILPQV